jgi:hypothetical protein
MKEKIRCEGISNENIGHARRDLLGTLKRVYEDIESLNMLKGWRLAVEAI